MKVRLLTSMAGPLGSFAYGDEVEMEDAEAARFLERGLAEPWTDDAIETAAASDSAETADLSRKRVKRG